MKDYLNMKICNITNSDKNLFSMKKGINNIINSNKNFNIKLNNTHKINHKVKDRKKNK